VKPASLQARLTVSLVAVLTVSLGALAAVVQVMAARALRRQFDERLLDDAVAVAGMAEDDGGAPDFEYESLPDFERADSPAYFEAWLDDGTVLGRSPSLGRLELPRARPARGAAAFRDQPLPDGRPGRVVELRQPLRIEIQGPGPQMAARRSDRFVTVAVARATAPFEDAVAGVRRWLFLLAGAALAAASAVAAAVVARGLRSTRALAAEIERLEPGRPGRLAPAADLPAELAPLVDKLNELLARVEESLAREKRFTADVSHELRTPLAALRVTLDVVASRERGASELREALAEVSGVVRQMQALCDNLLALARLDAGHVPIRPAEVELRALVDACWAPLAAAAAGRGLTFSNAIDPNARVVSDPDQLRIVIGNLLSNAAAYTAPGGAVTVRGPAGGGAPWLEVHDSGPPIPEALLPRVFDRFWRGDAARTGGIHCGIGLSLARGIAGTLSLALTARNTPDGGVAFRLAGRDGADAAEI
jgi:signal transduction histidine kinase